MAFVILQQTHDLRVLRQIKSPSLLLMLQLLIQVIQHCLLLEATLKHAVKQTAAGDPSCSQTPKI